MSIVDSPISGAEGDPAWQRVAFTLSDLVVGYEEMKSEFLAEIQHK